MLYPNPMTQLQSRGTRLQSRTTAARSEYLENYEAMNGEEWVVGEEGEGEGEGWEDEEGGEEGGGDEAFQTMTSGPSSRGGLRKRRRPACAPSGSRRHSYITLPTGSSGPGPAKPSRPSPKAAASSLSSQVGEPPSTITREDVVNGAFHGALFTAKYALDVFARAVHYLRYPLSGFVFLWLLVYAMDKMAPTIRSAFSPLCVVPGMSRNALCRDRPSLERPAHVVVDYPRLVETESRTFEQLLDDFVTGSALSLQVKHAEMATTDLIALVRISDLKARNTLAITLIDFVDDAKKTGKGLQKLSSKVGGAVDSIMAVNDFALKSIESARANEPSPWSYAALAPWAPKRKNTDEVVRDTFDEAMNTLSKHLERLILEAEANEKNLNDLEERLATLHELVAREDSSMSSAKSDLLADLWTKLGGNRKQLRNFDSHLGLLKDLDEYRQQARVHVTVALQMLKGMSADMDDMRERAAAPDLLGPSIPVEVHLKSIEMGLERLKEGRIRARRLEQEAVNRVLSINEKEGQ